MYFKLGFNLFLLSLDVKEEDKSKDSSGEKTDTKGWAMPLPSETVAGICVFGGAMYALHAGITQRTSSKTLSSEWGIVS